VAGRDEILARLRAARPPPVTLPDLGGFGIRYPDPRERFAQSVAEVGGACVQVRGPLEDELMRISEYASAMRVVSLVPGLRRANVDLATVTDPHGLHDVDFCVLPGEFGVAENGAVWVTNHGLANRAVAFLTQHLALVVSEKKIFNNLHEAYERLSLPVPGFGIFISGPSKTADIEQALVIGAHGARSCTVLLTE
jgi:L-lactate dehydrogenase complex protein LldG